MADCDEQGDNLKRYIKMMSDRSKRTEELKYRIERVLREHNLTCPVGVTVNVSTTYDDKVMVELDLKPHKCEPWQINNAISHIKPGWCSSCLLVWGTDRENLESAMQEIVPVIKDNFQLVSEAYCSIVVDQSTGD